MLRHCTKRITTSQSVRAEKIEKYLKKQMETVLGIRVGSARFVPRVLILFSWIMSRQLNGGCGVHVINQGRATCTGEARLIVLFGNRSGGSSADPVYLVLVKMEKLNPYLAIKGMGEMRGN